MKQNVVPSERIKRAILLVRGHRVLLDAHLAALYGVETRRLNVQVRRNVARFPDDFMFQLTGQEFGNLKSQIATSSAGWGGKRKLPRFAERELMVSFGPRSDRAPEERSRLPIVGSGLPERGRRGPVAAHPRRCSPRRLRAAGGPPLRATPPANFQELAVQRKP